MILDTFILLFKANSAPAVKDVEELGKKVDSLREKGKKRSDQENKDYKESQKQLKEQNDQLKEQQQRYDKLTSSITQYAAGYVSLKAITNRFTDTIQNNAALQTQADLIGQSASELKAFDYAAKSAGGSAKEASAYAEQMFDFYSSVGLGSKVPPIAEYFATIRKEIKKANGDLGQIRQTFQNFNMQGQGLQSTLMGSDAEYDKLISGARALTGGITEAGKASREYVAIWASYEQTIDDIVTKISGALLPAVKSSIEYLKSNGRWLANVFSPSQGEITAGAKSGNNQTSSRPEQDIAFWMSKGYTREQAAAWAAAAKRESSNNPNAVGDGGKARGLFQWHPDRQAAILKGTGIDVTNASYDQQLEAAAWEAEQRGDAARIKGTRSASAASAIHTRFFERPADIGGESMVRGRMALDLARNTSFGGGGSKSTNVTVGGVVVNTQATDARGIASDIGSHLKSEINIATQNIDDGIKY